MFGASIRCPMWYLFRRLLSLCFLQKQKFLVFLDVEISILYHRRKVFISQLELEYILGGISNFRITFRCAFI